MKKTNKTSVANEIRVGVKYIDRLVKRWILTIKWTYKSFMKCKTIIYSRTATRTPWMKGWRILGILLNAVIHCLLCCFLGLWDFMRAI